MFKRLKIRILVINMVIISVLLLVSLGAIYIITHKGTHDIIKKDLIRSLYEWKDVEKIIIEYEIDHRTDLDEKLLQTGEYKHIPWFLRFSAYAKIVKDTGEETFLAIIPLYTEIYEYAKENIEFSDEDFTTFDFEKKTWAVLSRDFQTSEIYIFQDVTTNTAYLNRLVITTIIVLASTLIAVFFISYFLMSRAVKPAKIAFEKQKQFISDASHEIRTPLSTIRANTELVLSHKKSQLGSDAKWLEYIKDETIRMATLTDELLYLAELEDKYISSELRYKFDFSEAVKKQVMGVEAVVFENNLQIESDIKDGIIVNGIKEKLIQVVVILINNAVKYTEENGKIDVTLKKIRSHAVLNVKNPGKGMKSEDIDKIFDRFYRSDSVRNSTERSYGLGLSIARTIVEKHGGTLICNSSPEGPTEFIMKIKI